MWWWSWCGNFSGLWAEGRLVWWGHVMQGYLLAGLGGGIVDEWEGLLGDSMILRWSFAR